MKDIAYFNASNMASMAKASRLTTRQIEGFISWRIAIKAERAVLADLEERSALEMLECNNKEYHHYCECANLVRNRIYEMERVCSDVYLDGRDYDWVNAKIEKALGVGA